uniref:valine--tRNA ligase n=1 Tax=Ditylenchus dipsaci TaxID=166011 RepID=A0A915CLQ9_9BILA
MLVAHLPLLNVALAFSAKLLTRLANLLTLWALIPTLSDHLPTFQVQLLTHLYPLTWYSYSLSWHPTYSSVTSTHSPDVSLPLPSGYSPTFVEAAWYEWWEKEGFFRPEYGRVLSVPNPKGNFTVVMPPPNVTGSLHVGHALATTVEDVMCRWHRMKGKTVLYNPGCDHAGIATQVVVEKKILQVWKWKDEKQHTIHDQIKKLGASVDWDRHVFSMDPKVVRAVTEAFIRLREKGLIYRSNRLVNWSCTLRSAISDIEVDKKELSKGTFLKVPGYEGNVKFGVLVSFAYAVENSEEEVIVATTRIETMLGDVAIAVHPEDKCKHPFLDRTLLIIADSFVDMSFGTGAVKITPSHDHVDYEVGLRHKLPFINILSDDGYLLDNCGLFSGMKRFDARMKVIEALKSECLFRGVADNPMVVPICSRSSDVIEPMIKSQWYVKCSLMCQKALEVVENGDLKIIPDIHHVSWKRYLEDSRDWCISRQLWWGHRIPAYFVLIDDLSISKGDLIDDRYWVAAYTEDEAICKAAVNFNVDISKITVKQDEDVLDTWFSAGLWPFAITGWPEQTRDFEQFFPGHLMETGHDILFFWVARMVFLSQELCGKLPFDEVFLHAVIRDAHGRKMSKSLGNVTDPLDIIRGITLDELKKKLEEGNLDPKELSTAKSGLQRDFKLGIPECGTDALRFALLAYHSNGRDINLDVFRLLGYRTFCNKIWQAYKFVMMNLPNSFPLEDRYKLSGHEDEVDKWILSQLSSCVAKCNVDIGAYRFTSAANNMFNFWLYQFCDIYVECVKDVLRSDDATRVYAVQQVLYLCVETFLRLISPFMPFLSEELWQRLAKRRSEMSASVCVAEYPEPEDYPFYEESLKTLCLQRLLNINRKLWICEELL